MSWKTKNCYVEAVLTTSWKTRNVCWENTSNGYFCQTSDLWQQLELASELESDLRDTVDWGRNWFVDFNAGKTRLVSFDRSNNTGAMLLMCEWMGLFLRKNHLLRCWSRLPYDHVWNTVVMSRLVLLVSTWSCWYYFGVGITKLAELVPVPYSRRRSTRYSDRLYDFSVTIPRC